MLYYLSGQVCAMCVKFFQKRHWALSPGFYLYRSINQTNMNRLIVLVPVLILFCCKSADESGDAAKLSVIPKPATATIGDGYFEVTSSTGIFVEGATDETERVGSYLASILSRSTGFDLKVTSTTEKAGPGNIVLAIAAGAEELGPEGYELNVSTDGIRINAKTPEGIFRGVQTLRQLLPAEIESDVAQRRSWTAPVVSIRDFPAYAYRGAMLDVSRHFFGVDDVKRFIDLISLYKLNYLHLHLSDDQGWRIEIKSWPNLTTVGGTSEVGDGKGGYYTQEQYGDIVRYAAERYITIVPEIDMPGHTNAALASYPELNCDGKARELYRGIEVGFSSLCTDKDITYQFIDDVVRELAAITPGPFIHLGGDESHATKHEDYLPFVNRVQDIAEKHSKRMIGWEEIAQANLKPGTVVQFWSNEDHAKLAAEKGATMVLSPSKRVYLDMKYDKSTKLGQDWAALIEVRDSYDWNPAKLVPGLKKENILGVEAPLWTETISTMDEIEYMVFPRIVGISEVAWSQEGNLGWGDFEKRLVQHEPRFRVLGVDFYRSSQVNWTAER